MSPRQLRWDPSSNLQSLTEDFDRWLESMAQISPSDVFIPMADVEETDDAYIVDVELPGVRKEDIDVTISGRRLSITGERKEKEREGILRRRTRNVGRFQFEVTLPGDVEDKGVTASMEGGVLSVRIPKASAERPRHVAVS
jgi:HSP20 family protein